MIARFLARAAPCSLAAVFCAEAAFAASPLSITGEGALRGDGVASVVLTLTAPPETAAEEITVFADAGTLGAVVPSGEGRFEVRFTAPRIGAPMKVYVEARIRQAGPDGTARHLLELTPSETETGEARSGGPFDLRAPARLVLGRHPTVVISVRPPGDARPLVSASAGRLSPWTPTADGRLQATWELPHTKLPQVALLSATDETGAVADFLPVALDGVATVDLATEPSVQVRLRLGSALYGPFHSGESGRSKVPLLAPPGMGKATVVALDPMGNTSESTIDLHPPPFGKLAVFCPDNAEGIVLFAIDANGVPAKRQGFELAASQGRLGPAEDVAPGIFRSRLHLPEEVGGEEIVLRASILGEEAPAVSCTAPVPPEMPSAVAVRLGTSSHVAGSAVPVDVSIELSYPGKRRPQAVDVQLAADVGEVSQPRQDESSKTIDRASGASEEEPAGRPKADQGRTLRATWTLPDNHSGRAKAVLTARAAPSGARSPRGGAHPDGLTSAAALELRGGPATRLDVEPNDLCLVADGGKTVVTIRAFDAFENPTAGESLEASAGIGIVGTPQKTSEGIYRAVYSSPQRRGKGQDTIVVRSPVDPGPIEGSTVIGLVAPPRPAVSGGIGWLEGERAGVSGPLFSASLHFPLAGVQHPALQKLSVAVESGISGEAVPLWVRGSWRTLGPASRHPSRGCLSRAGVFFGGGVGGRVTSNAFAPAASGHLGLDVPAGKGRLILQSSYWQDRDSGIPSLLLGYQIELGVLAERRRR